MVGGGGGEREVMADGMMWERYERREKRKEDVWGWRRGARSNVRQWEVRRH